MGTGTSTAIFGSESETEETLSCVSSRAEITSLSRDPFSEALVLFLKPAAGGSDPAMDSGGGGSGSPVVDSGSPRSSWSLYDGGSSETTTATLREGSLFVLFFAAAALPLALERLVVRPDLELLCNFFVVTRTRPLSFLVGWEVLNISRQFLSNATFSPSPGWCNSGFMFSWLGRRHTTLLKEVGSRRMEFKSATAAAPKESSGISAVGASLRFFLAGVFVSWAFKPFFSRGIRVLASLRIMLGSSS